MSESAMTQIKYKIDEENDEEREIKEEEDEDEGGEKSPEP